jgi:phosphonate transport system substrate-binding protein
MIRPADPERRRNVATPVKTPVALLLLFLFLLFHLGGCDSPTPTIDPQLKQQIPIAEKTGDPTAVRIAVGAMITPREGFAFYRDFLDYVSKKIDRPVEYVDKESYAEINDMLENGKLDVAFVCSGPYVDGAAKFGLKPLVSPQAYNASVYYSYVIVPIDSKAKSFTDLRNKRFAFTDPQSNTGTLVPTYMLARMNETPDSFFASYDFTYAHDQSIKAVATKLVDGASVDSLIWEYANHRNPLYTARTKIIERSPPYGIPPVVVRPGLDPELEEKLRSTFLNAHRDPLGRKILAGMMVERFNPLDDSLYDPVREMKAWLASRTTAEK